MVPSGRVIVPSRAWLTPLPAWGAPVTVYGGHAAAHASVHADVPFLSAWNRYSVRPSRPTRALPGILEMAASETVAVPLARPAAAGRLASAAAGGAAGLGVAGLELVVLELLLQAATTRPTPAAPIATAIRFLI